MPGRTACAPSPPRWGRIIAGCASASAIPATRTRVHGHVLQNFSKADDEWLVPMLSAIAEAAPLLAKDDDAGFMNKVALQPRAQTRKPEKSRKKKEENNGIQMRHRRIAQCRQIHAVQRADPDGGGAGGELSVLHHRAQCRRGGGARSAAGKLAAIARSAEIIPTRITFVDIAGPGARRLQGRRASATSSSPPSARSMRSPMWCAVLRMTTSPMSKAASIPSATPKWWKPN